MLVYSAVPSDEAVSMDVRSAGSALQVASDSDVGLHIETTTASTVASGSNPAILQDPHYRITSVKVQMEDYGEIEFAPKNFPQLLDFLQGCNDNTTVTLKRQKVGEVDNSDTLLQVVESDTDGQEAIQSAAVKPQRPPKQQSASVASSHPVISKVLLAPLTSQGSFGAIHKIAATPSPQAGSLRHGAENLMLPTFSNTQLSFPRLPSSFDSKLLSPMPSFLYEQMPSFNMDPMSTSFGGLPSFGSFHSFEMSPHGPATASNANTSGRSIPRLTPTQPQQVFFKVPSSVAPGYKLVRSNSMRSHTATAPPIQLEENSLMEPLTSTPTSHFVVSPDGEYCIPQKINVLPSQNNMVNFGSLFTSPIVYKSEDSNSSNSSDAYPRKRGTKRHSSSGKKQHSGHDSNRPEQPRLTGNQAVSFGTPMFYHIPAQQSNICDTLKGQLSSAFQQHNRDQNSHTNQYM